ncbi:MAG: Coenzyme F420 hydrogenase/dehydrogenase, beta subunit C-terminal domain [Oscillospiraceae bacterium]|nr:Coenzyme F420 hydrogenase/dehydrogenase, beta subunit C-terminal domain [Oscillospiraceae bacterium]
MIDTRKAQQHMINIKKKHDCSGCHACANICPQKCIVMKADEEGFLYPSVDLTKCVKCGLCQKVCHRHSPLKNHNQPEAYACYVTNESVRMQSSSGGVFTFLAQEILNHGGAVFGAAFDEDLTVKHICITEKRDLGIIRGSKYVQSRIGDTYASAKEMLQKGQPVFFTGTPCQIGGLKLYLGKEYDNLYTADVICHGAPSPKVWKTYLDYMEAQFGSKISRCPTPLFRSKATGWIEFSMHIHFDNNQEYCTPFGQDSYMDAFLHELILRPSCYHCDFKSLHRNSDITMADFWGVGLLAPDMFDNKGTSLVLINSSKGQKLFDCIKKTAIYKPVCLDTAIMYNQFAYKSADYPFKRKKFMDNVSSENFTILCQSCINKSFLERVYHKAIRILKRLGNAKN